MISSQPKKNSFREKQGVKFRAPGTDSLETAQTNFKCPIYPAKRDSPSASKIREQPATSTPSFSCSSTRQNSETSSSSCPYVYSISHKERKRRDRIRIRESGQTQLPAGISEIVLVDVSLRQEGCRNRVSSKSIWLGTWRAHVAARFAGGYEDHI